MQVFNLANARKIGTHDYNIFSGLLSNWWWPGIVTVILLGQIVMVEFGGFALSCNLHGLNWKQWLICIAFGAGTWVVAFLAKLIPNAIIKTLPQAGVKEVNPIGEPTSLALASRGRYSSTHFRNTPVICLYTHFHTSTHTSTHKHTHICT